jgi:hypothetical protein
MKIDDVSKKAFKTPDCLEQDKFKPGAIDWLIGKFNLPPFNHSFKDKWISLNIWHGQLSIGFDFRVTEQVDIFNAIPESYKGCKQVGTGKIVNTQYLYFDIENEWQVEYPSIKSTKIVNKDLHKDNDGDDFYTYDHILELSDGTQMLYHNQSSKCDISIDTFITKVQERYLYENIFLPAIRK